MKRPIILASTSPRRIEIMSWLDVPFETDSSDFDEKQIRHESPRELTRLLAEAKAGAVVENHPNALVIGSDSVISFQGHILEKSRDNAAQRKMLKLQSGKPGKVFTSLCVIDTATGEKILETDIVDYQMPKLTPEQIEDYVASGKGSDKAGGFGLQDNDGMFIETLRGCFPAAMGLPICKLAGILEQMGIAIPVDIKEIAESRTGHEC